ncbi:DUF5984 family protein [Cellulomonas xiejunii]|uniref:DUF5984 family protein n=1 Tax=Cellulomonas xiejunii TaxID=2968083 RepID=UPI001D0E836E|nr:DUF5984 family protein [Cellulomonas xiejunii]MCC2313633.1 DUF5984 family protein [Cellulomonas xiejunii]
MIAFRFELRRLDDVAPWGDAQPTLHWFGLTDGWYWLEVGGDQVLRLAQDDGPHPYVDYEVARLWEDVLALTPAVLEPVPADLVPFVASDRADWPACPQDDEEETPAASALADDLRVTAALWHGEHRLDVGYLRGAPRLAFWRTVADGRDEITVDWRHDDDRFTVGRARRWTVPTSAYEAAVISLDHAVVSAMSRRVEEVAQRGGLPGVHLDVDGLRREHRERERLRTRHEKHARTTDWDDVRRGAAHLLSPVVQG